MSSTLNRFVVLSQFTIEQLSAIYDNFTLTNPEVASAKPKGVNAVSDYMVVPSPDPAGVTGMNYEAFASTGKEKDRVGGDRW